ncbi:excalibur calcium-binding domain-containing protein [Parafrankia sp. EUN1f]|uniref:excalibur calcium-binding domain-containing protein n=1 Tax=Parafrankia sp. EUN1f TaxID=102897 RepID=UPI0001C43A8F|nr:excalibur calcium-binding domain-containing protein [Parafrankia sp. EUN1f]EFC83852.1 Excalibur domain protein [Parafrankia sp. EUN1f]
MARRPAEWSAQAITWARLHPRASSGIGGVFLVLLLVVAVLVPAQGPGNASTAATRTDLPPATTSPAGGGSPTTAPAPPSVPEVVSVQEAAPTPAAPPVTRRPQPTAPALPVAASTPASRQKTTQKATKPAPSATRSPAKATRSPAVFYGSCLTARLAGAAPLYEGQPGYSRWLDWDGDGVACD